MMKTLMMMTSEHIQAAARLLLDGELVVFPTETVYGLGADASNAEAIARLYALKGRPSAHPVIVHGPDASLLDSWGADVPQIAWQLAERFWPGPLTLVVPRAAHVGDWVTGGQDTVALRVPAHPTAQALLQAFTALKGELPAGLAAPSANRFGQLSATTPEAVRTQFGEETPCLLTGARPQVGIESTIVHCLPDNRVRVLRPGMITAEALQAAGAQLAETSEAAQARVSGGLPAHYAPRTPMQMISVTDAMAPDSAIALLSREGMGLPETGWKAQTILPNDAAGYAQGLYEALRQLDAAQARVIYVVEPPDEPAWAGIQDRLQRAAAASAKIEAR